LHPEATAAAAAKVLTPVAPLVVECNRLEIGMPAVGQCCFQTPNAGITWQLTMLPYSRQAAMRVLQGAMTV
jgi:hypothetical protein